MLKDGEKIPLGTRDCSGNCTCKKEETSYKNILLPWNKSELEGWSIVGMNHYYVKGVKHLYCAMTDISGKAIQAEGIDEASVFDKLVKKALEWQ